jgi:hypothetical protein
MRPGLKSKPSEKTGSVKGTNKIISAIKETGNTSTTEHMYVPN